MKLFELLAAAAEKRPWLVVLAAVIITAFMAVGMSRLTTELSQEAMMPKGYESIQAWDAVGDKFGGVSFESALITADDVTSPRIAKAVLDITPEELEKEGLEKGYVTKVDTYLNGFKKQLEMAGQPLPENDIMLAVALNRFLSTDYAKSEIIGKVISEDKKAGLVKFQLDPDLGESEQAKAATAIGDYLEKHFGTKGAEYYLYGNGSFQKDAEDLMNRETRVLFGAALLFIMLILYLTFRRVSDIFLPLLIIVVAIWWILGFMGWVGIAYTTMSVAIMPLMLGINIAYVIHIMSRYYEEREIGNNPFDSVTISIKTVGVAVFLTAVTTIIGFASFTITDMPPMRDFGIVCLLGIAFSFILSVTLLPAAIVLRDRRKKTEKLEAHLEKMKRRRREARYGVVIDKVLVRSSMAAYNHHWIVTGGFILLIALAIFASFNLKTGADIGSFLPEDSPSQQANRKITEYFGPQRQDVILLEGDVLEPENLRAILSMEDAIAEDSRNADGEGKYFTREGILSIADLIADANGGKIPESSEEIEAILNELGKRMPITSFVTPGETAAMVMINASIPGTEDEMRVISGIYRDKASDLQESTGVDARVTGFTVLISDLMGNIMPTQFRTSGLALLLCLMVLIIMFKSFFYGLATLVVVVFGIIMELIMLYALGWPLDFMTVTISSLLIGIGVDFGIHVTHRFREELHERGEDLGESIKRTVLHVGRALVAAAFTTCGVFAILGISSMIPMRRFGWTIAIGLLAALVGAVLLLPSLLAILRKRSEEKEQAGEGESRALSEV